jgi:F0F1-type ATP synthase membrane subunit b/b'
LENFEIFHSVIFPYANLVIFLILAWFILRKPLLNGLAAKREAYMGLLERANKAKTEAEAKQRELDQKLKDLEREVEQIKGEVRQQAEVDAKAIVVSAQTLAEHLKKEAKRIAEAEVAAAKEDVQREILQQVRKSAAEEIQRTLDDGRQHQVVKKGLAELSQMKEVRL